MMNTFKLLVVTASIALVSTATDNNFDENSNKHLLLEDKYACSWWPTCRDPDDMKPMPNDSSAPKPTGDKDTTKDKKDEAQLA